MNKRQKHEALFLGIRGAVRGWAFCNKQMLEGRIKHAEQLRDALAPELRAEADQLIRPLRDALSVIIALAVNSEGDNV